MTWIYVADIPSKEGNLKYSRIKVHKIQNNTNEQV